MTDIVINFTGWLGLKSYVISVRQSVYSSRGFSLFTAACAAAGQHTNHSGIKTHCKQQCDSYQQMLACLVCTYTTQQQWRADIMWHVVRQCAVHGGLRKRKRGRGNDRSCVYTCEGLVTPPGGNPRVVVTLVTIYQHLLWHQTSSTRFPPSYVGETVTLTGLENPDNPGSWTKCQRAWFSLEFINRFSYSLLLFFTCKCGCSSVTLIIFGRWAPVAQHYFSVAAHMYGGAYSMFTLCFINVQFRLI